MESSDFHCVKGSENSRLPQASDSNYPDIKRKTHVITLFTSTLGFSEETVDTMLTLGLHHKNSSICTMPPQTSEQQRKEQKLKC